jgi:hypothetical protein
VVLAINLMLNQVFTLSPAGRGERGRVRGAEMLARGAAHLTLPSLRDGPLPLPPEGRRGVLVGGLGAKSRSKRADR